MEEEDIQQIKRRKLEAQQEQIAEQILEKTKAQIEHQKILEQAEKEMSAPEPVAHGSFEQIFLMIGAALLIVTLPFLLYVNGLILTLFAVGVALAAGLTSPKKSYSPGLNLFMSVIGALYFEYAAIIHFHTEGASFVFLLYQALAVVFLLAAYFSMITFRRKVLEKEESA